MGNVIEGHFPLSTPIDKDLLPDLLPSEYGGEDFDEYSAEYFEDEEGIITGVRCSTLAADFDEEIVYCGYSEGGKIYSTSQIKLEEMNTFCIMWLANFMPSVMKECFLEDETPPNK